METRIERLVRIAVNNARRAEASRSWNRECELYKRAERGFEKARALGWKG